MSTQTANLGLTLPAGNENVSRSIINENWQKIDDGVARAAKPLTIQLDTVTNVSGSYAHTTENEFALSTMKPIQIEFSNPDAFQAEVTVTVTSGEILLECDDVSGTSDVWVTVMKEVNPEEADPEELDPTEFDILAGRIGVLGNLTTTNKNDTVQAINEVNSSVATLNGKIINMELATNLGQYTSLDTFKSNLIAKAQTLITYEAKPIQFVFTTNVNPFTAWSTFVGWIQCIQYGATSLYFVCNVASNNAEHVIIGYSNGTWTIKKTTNT